MRSLSRNLLTLAGAVCLTGQLGAATLEPAAWPHLRGPDHVTGVVEKADWLKDLGQAKVLWKADTGIGCAAVAVADGKALTLGNRDDKETLYALDAKTGGQLWSFTYDEPLGAVFYKGGPNMTPLIHKGKVYWTSRQGQAFCLDLADGKEVWKRHIQIDEALNPPRWGFSGAPLLHGETLILNMGDAGMAIKISDGSTVWRSRSGGAGYAAPVPVDTAAGKRVLLFTAGELVQVNPDDGKVDWRTSWQTDWDVNAASPIPTKDGILISSGYRSGTSLIAADGSKRVWFSDKVKHQMSGPVLFQGLVYGVNGHKGEPGQLYCMDPATGEVKWAQDGFGNGSVICVGGKLLALTEDGQVVLAEAKADGYKELGRTKAIEKGHCWNTPALADGLVFVKNDSGALVCVDIRPKS